MLDYRAKSPSARSRRAALDHARVGVGSSGRCLGLSPGAPQPLLPVGFLWCGNSDCLVLCMSSKKGRRSGPALALFAPAAAPPLALSRPPTSRSRPTRLPFVVLIMRSCFLFQAAAFCCPARAASCWPWSPSTWLSAALPVQTVITHASVLDARRCTERSCDSRTCFSLVWWPPLGGFPRGCVPRLAHPFPGERSFPPSARRLNRWIWPLPDHNRRLAALALPLAPGFGQAGLRALFGDGA